MDTKVWDEIARLKREVEALKARDFATYNTIYSASEPTDHFMNPTLDTAWTWQGAPYAGTPPVASLSVFPSHLVLGSAAIASYYLSRTISGNGIAARFIPSGKSVFGLRIDDGGTTNYCELRVWSEYGRVMLAVRAQGGGLAGDGINHFICELPNHPLTIGLAHSGSTLYAYYSLEPHLVNADAHGLKFVYQATHTLTPSRCGIVLHNVQTTASDADFRISVDWFDFQSFSASGSAPTRVTYQPIGARYTSDTAQSFGTGAQVVVNYEDVDYDPYSLVTVGAAWVFTVPVTGIYHVDASILWASSTAWADGESTAFVLQRNGADFSVLKRYDANASAAATLVHVTGSDFVSCNAGDTLAVTAEQNTGGNLTRFNSGLFNYISIAKLPW
jgi:hypothetical protein